MNFDFRLLIVAMEILIVEQLMNIITTPKLPMYSTGEEEER